MAVRPGPTVCSAVEHHAVLHACEALGDNRIAPVDANGVVDLERLAALLDPAVSVVSVMLANNEVGTIQPLAEVAALVRERAPEAVLHTDAVQAFPWLDLATSAAGADLVAVSAHKFGGPKGVGALVVRQGVEVRPIIHGGGQERDRRSGTHNVAGIVAMAAAMRAAVDEREAVVARVGALRDRLADGLLADRSRLRRDGRPVDEDRRQLPPVVRGRRVRGVARAARRRRRVRVGRLGLRQRGGRPVARAGGHGRLPGTGRRVRCACRSGTGTTEADVDLALAAVPAAVARLRGG